MSNYRFHIGNRFAHCRHIANARDPHRGRDVRLYHVPGNFEVVGVDDGVDRWICPATIDPFSAGVARIFDDIRAGKRVEVRTLCKPRVAVVVPAEPVKPRKERHVVRP